MEHLHDTWFGDSISPVVVTIAVKVLARFRFARSTGVTFPFEGRRIAQRLDATFALGHCVGSKVVEEFVPVDFETALPAGGCGPGAVALDELLGFYAGVALDIIDVLGVVGKELAIVLEEADEGMGGSGLSDVRECLACEGVENAAVVLVSLRWTARGVSGFDLRELCQPGIFVKEVYVEHRLRIIETLLLELGIEACVL